MIVTVLEPEMRTAICEWLKNRHGLTLQPSDLTPKVDVVSDYESTTTTMVGYTFEVEKLKGLK